MCHLSWIRCLKPSCNYPNARTTPQGERVVPGELEPCGQLCPPKAYTNAVKKVDGRTAWEMCGYCGTILEPDTRDDGLLLLPTIQIGRGSDVAIADTFVPKPVQPDQHAYREAASPTVSNVAAQAGRTPPQQGFVEEIGDIDMTEHMQPQFDSLSTEDMTLEDLHRDPIGVYKALTANGPRMGKPATHASLALLLKPDALSNVLGQSDQPNYDPSGKGTQFPVVRLNRGTPHWLHNKSCVKLPNGQIIHGNWVRFTREKIEENLYEFYLNSLDLEDNAKLRVPLLGEELILYRLRQKRNVRPNETDEALDLEYKAWVSAISLLMPSSESWLPPKQRSAEYWAKRTGRQGRKGTKSDKVSRGSSETAESASSATRMPPPSPPKPRWPFPPYGKPKHQLPPGFSARWDLTTLPSGQVVATTWISYAAAKVEASLKDFYLQLRGLEKNRELSCPIMGETMKDFKARQWKHVRPKESEAVLCHEYVAWLDLDSREKGFQSWWIPEDDRENARIRMNEAFYQLRSGTDGSPRETAGDEFGIKPYQLAGLPPTWFDAQWEAVQLKTGQVIPRGWAFWNEHEICLRAKDAYEKCHELVDNEFVNAPLLGESRNRYRQRQWEDIRMLEDAETLDREYAEWIEQLPCLTPGGSAWLTPELQKENEIDANPPSIFTGLSPAPLEILSTSTSTPPETKPWTYYTVQLLQSLPSWLPTNFKGLPIACTRLRSGQIVPEFWRNIRTALDEDELATYYEQGLTLEKNAGLAAPLLGESSAQYKRRQATCREYEGEERFEAEFVVYADQMLKELGQGESGDWWLREDDRLAKFRRGKQKVER